jgi:hypothetical protein
MNDTVHTYPLKFIWMKGNKTFYILQPYDNMGDEQKSSEILKQVSHVRERFQEFYNYWQHFGINSPTNDIPDSAEIIYSSDSIVVSYSLDEKQEKNNIRKIYSKIGSLKKMKEITDHREIITRPQYTVWEEKYVCNGWRTQIFLDHILSKEIITRLELDSVGSHQVPARVIIDSLKLGIISEKVRSVIYIKEYEFDIPLRELKAPK